MNDNFQSGKTQAIDLDELHVQSANRPTEMKARGEFELDKWGDDPWSSTEESRKKRRWAEDMHWSGDDEEEKKEKPEGFWESNEEEMKAGWKAPKRGDVLEADDGWGDWDNFGGAPKQLAQEEESKDFGGFRRVQAASQYAQIDTSNYVDGHAQRDDLYRSKEEFGTANVRERKGDPYSQQEEFGTANVRERNGDPYANLNSGPQQMVMPAMQLVGEEWGNETQEKSKDPDSNNEDDMRSSAKISPQTPAVDDIPGVTRASIIIFQADTSPVVYELKKVVTTIGRGLDNMVILNDQYASRKHLSINYVNGRFELFALSVDNIASVNKYPFTHVVLMNGDQIEVGATRIRFILGPISDAHMTLSEPVNGRPMHLDPPPQDVRSPKTTRKNLILLIAAVGIIVLALLIGLVAMAVSKPDDKKKTATVAEITESDANADKAQDAKRPADEPKPEFVELLPADEQLIDAMLESSSAATPIYMGSNMDIAGTMVRFKISTTPSGARIYNASDGSLRGTTKEDYAITEFSQDSTKDKLVIRLDGYVEKTIEIDYMTSVDETLELEKDTSLEPAKPAAKPASTKPKPKPKPKPRPGPTRPNGRLII
ncbi:MAG: FHA domain-containing protein [Proteobacteria bacterium]|nr:FHA domain-containing protein [Pseudomonadota bacterium]